MRYDINYKKRDVEYQIEGHTYKETCKVFKISETNEVSKNKVIIMIMHLLIVKKYYMNYAVMITKIYD